MKQEIFDPELIREAARRSVVNEALKNGKAVRVQFGGLKDFRPAKCTEALVLESARNTDVIYTVECTKLKLIGKAFVPRRDFPKGIVGTDVDLYCNRFVDYSAIGREQALSELGRRS